VQVPLSSPAARALDVLRSSAIINVDRRASQPAPAYTMLAVPVASTLTLTNVDQGIGDFATVRLWLTNMGMQQYAADFESAGIDAATVRRGLVDSQLKAAKVVRLSHRQLIAGSTSKIDEVTHQQQQQQEMLAVCAVVTSFLTLCRAALRTRNSALVPPRGQRPQ